jgi:hypothetical protein
MEKNANSVIEAAIEALEYWSAGNAKDLPIGIGASLARYAALLEKGVVVETVTNLSTTGHIEALKRLIEKKYCSCCGHKLDKQT